MRYLLLGMAMLSDIALFLALIVVWSFGIRFLHLGGLIILLFISSLALRSWKDSGGFDNWKKSEIKKFLTNAQEYGL